MNIPKKLNIDLEDGDSVEGAIYTLEAKLNKLIDYLQAKEEVSKEMCCSFHGWPSDWHTQTSSCTCYPKEASKGECDGYSNYCPSCGVKIEEACLHDINCAYKKTNPPESKGECTCLLTRSGHDVCLTCPIHGVKQDPPEHEEEWKKFTQRVRQAIDDYIPDMDKYARSGFEESFDYLISDFIRRNYIGKKTFEKELYKVWNDDNLICQPNKLSTHAGVANEWKIYFKNKLRDLLTSLGLGD